MNQIPLKRLPFYVLIAGLIPILAASTWLLNTLAPFSDTLNRIEALAELSLIIEKRQAGNLSVINHYKNADHFYIDKHLETITPLEKEIESLQKTIAHQNYTGDETIQKRLSLITEGANNIVFTEGMVQTYPFFQETTESLAHPVEINVNDLKKLLVAIEGVEIPPYLPSPERPQLIIIDFKLDKRTPHENNEVFLLNLKLLKREYM